MPDPARLIRHSLPNKYDEAPFMTEILVETPGKRERYVQVSKDTEKPRWELIQSESL